MKYRLQCVHCAETFVHRGDELPDECPFCHQYIGPDGKPTVAAPMISLARHREPDKLYRSMEAGAEHRMNVAAELSNQPVSEFSSMKMTNMKSSIREGDTTFMPSTPTPPVNMGQAMGQLDPNVAAGLKRGPAVGAGSNQLGVVQRFHSANHRQMNSLAEVRPNRGR